MHLGACLEREQSASLILSPTLSIAWNQMVTLNLVLGSDDTLTFWQYAALWHSAARIVAYDQNVTSYCDTN